MEKFGLYLQENQYLSKENNMKTPEEIKQIEDDEMLDDYGHLPFKRAGNRFAKYRNAKAYVIDDDGTRYELSEYERKMAQAVAD
jgi:hypothetical protein